MGGKFGFAFMAGLLIWCASYAEPARIMFLGDSRTAGPRSRDCYRLYLDRILTNVGFEFDFVGGLKGHEGAGYAADSVFDVDHDGHWGWAVDKMLWDTWSTPDQGISTWAKAANPDIILALLGTTDLLQESDSLHLRFERTQREIKMAIDSMRTANPEVVIFLASLYPVYDSSLTVMLDQFNPYIKNLVDSTSTFVYRDSSDTVYVVDTVDTIIHFIDPISGLDTVDTISRIDTVDTIYQIDSTQYTISPIYHVDIWTGFNRTTDLVDIWHANQKGCTMIAERWYDALLPVLNSMQPSAARNRPLTVLQPSQAMPAFQFSIFKPHSGGAAFMPDGRRIPASRTESDHRKRLFPAIMVEFK